MLGSRKTAGAIRMPATAPTAAASPQPSASIQSTRMPASRADAGFWAAARIARPSGVRRKNANSPMSSATSTTIIPTWCGPEIGRARERQPGEGRGHRLLGVAPDGAGHRVEDGQQADEHHDDGKDRGVMQRSQDHALDPHTERERDRHHRRQRQPERQVPFQQLPAQEGAEHGQLALREIDVVGGDEDHDERQRQAARRWRRWRGRRRPAGSTAPCSACPQYPR